MFALVKDPAVVAEERIVQRWGELEVGANTPFPTSECSSTRAGRSSRASFGSDRSDISTRSIARLHGYCSTPSDSTFSTKQCITARPFRVLLQSDVSRRSGRVPTSHPPAN